jgi:ubiquinone biosynthesis protein Coq4
MKQDERAAIDAYLGKNIRHPEPTSSLMRSTSRWLNHPVMREVIPIWLLRKNGPDFPVEADHTLGLATAMQEIQPAAEINEMMEAERKINPALDQFLTERFVSDYSNDSFNKFKPGTVGGIMGRQIRDFGFDLTLGVENPKDPQKLSAFEFWRLRGRQTHDFDHIIVGGGFDSIGENVVIFGRCANNARHLSPELAAALSSYTWFAGLRMMTRPMLNYPLAWPKALECVEQGMRVGRLSTPMWNYKYEQVFEMTPTEARKHFGVEGATDIDSARESAIFREEPLPMATAAE